jgi:hypothetical protein
VTTTTITTNTNQDYNVITMIVMINIIYVNLPEFIIVNNIIQICILGGTIFLILPFSG